MSLRARLAFGVGLIVAVTVALAGFAAEATIRNELEGEIDEFLRDRVDLIVGFSNRGGGRRPGPGQFPIDVGGRGTFAEFDAITQIVSSDGDVLGLEGQARLPVEDVDLEIAAGLEPTTTRTVDVDGTDHRMITESFADDVAIQVARSLDETDRILADVRRRLLVAGAIGTALAVGVGWIFARRQTRPVERVTAAAEEVARTQDLGSALPVEGPDEVARLAASFNTMLDALETSREQQRRLVMDASHELRTPLTSLRTSIEVLEHGDQIAPELRERLLTNASSELRELSGLVAELVELATDTHTGDDSHRSLRLGAIVTTALERAGPRYSRRIAFDASGDDRVVGSEQMLERAVSNLLDNAVKFSPDATPIEVTLVDRTVTVLDHGPGIEPEDLDHIFDRFYRATSARTEAGSGLGLSIVGQIVADHGGSTFARNEPGGGAAIGFELPEPPTDRELESQH